MPRKGVSGLFNMISLQTSISKRTLFVGGKLPGRLWYDNICPAGSFRSRAPPGVQGSGPGAGLSDLTSSRGGDRVKIKDGNCLDETLLEEGDREEDSIIPPGTRITSGRERRRGKEKHRGPPSPGLHLRPPHVTFRRSGRAFRVVFFILKDAAEVEPMIVKEYCESMEKQLAAWRANVQKMLLIAETLQERDRQADARQVENLQSLIHDLAKVSDRLKYECLPA
jgi:hypothetical protein